MNQQYNRPNRYESPVYKLGLLALGTLACVAALALQQPAHADGIYSVKVSISDLDLSAVEGIRVARERVHDAAKRLCERADDPEDLSHHHNFLVCVDAATVSAMQQVAHSTVASVARNSVP
jgi:UrcA family protein